MLPSTVPAVPEPSLLPSRTAVTLKLSPSGSLSAAVLGEPTPVKTLPVEDTPESSTTTLVSLIANGKSFRAVIAIVIVASPVRLPKLP